VKSKLFAAFGLGALTASIALGVVQLANASGAATITACANKKTGTMRYITKGKCKTTEDTLRWNQQGPQGLTGATGPQGAEGSPGINGTSAAKVYDSTGTYIGQLVDVTDGLWYDEYRIIRNGVYFFLPSHGGVYGEIYFDGPNCTGTPFVNLSASSQWPLRLSQSEAFLTLEPGSRTVRWYRPNSDSLTSLTPASVLGDYPTVDEIGINDWIRNLDGVGSCTNLSGQSARLHRTLEPLTPPVIFATNSPLQLSSDG
jgi:hypothetical protein